MIQITLPAHYLNIKLGVQETLDLPWGKRNCTINRILINTRLYIKPVYLVK